MKKKNYTYFLRPFGFVIIENKTKVDMILIYPHGLFTRLNLMKMSAVDHVWPTKTFNLIST